MPLKKLALRLDFHSTAPIYAQIVDQIRSQAANKVLQPGDQLPTVRGLARDLHINVNTAARAYRLLDQARVISTQQGRGTYVSELPAFEPGPSSSDAALRHLARRYVSDALRLGYSRREVRAIIGTVLRSKRELHNTE